VAVLAIAEWMGVDEMEWRMLRRFPPPHVRETTWVKDGGTLGRKWRPFGSSPGARQDLLNRSKEKNVVLIYRSISNFLYINKTLDMKARRPGVELGILPTRKWNSQKGRKSSRVSGESLCRYIAYGAKSGLPDVINTMKNERLYDPFLIFFPPSLCVNIISQPQPA
jgi:hypothetical protein